MKKGSKTVPTAPSFQDYEFLSEPFAKNNKLYISVRNPKTGNKREVRWYSEEEYAKQYGKKETIPDHTKAFPNLKRVRGFANGPILVVRGDKNEDEDWLRESPARYAMGIRWYFASDDALPTSIPAHLNLIPLAWEEFRSGDDQHMKAPEELSKIINQKERELHHNV